MRRWKRWLLVIGILAGLAVAATSAVAMSAEQPEPPLSKFALQRSELPKGTQWGEEGRLAEGDSRHVLPARSSLKVASYTDSYFSCSIAPIGAQDPTGRSLGRTAAAAVIQTIYRFADDAEALAQWEHLANTFKQASRSTLPIADQSSEGARAVALQFVGSEGDVIYWFLRVKGRTLTALCVDDLQALDGIAHPSGRSFFETLVGSLQNK